MFLRTQRLLLRPAWPEDVPALTAAIAHESVARMLARVPWPYGEADARTFVAREQDPYLPSLLITLPGAGGMIVGGVGLHEDNGEASVGYWVTPELWGCGIATEALRGLVGLAKLCGHRRLVAFHAIDNPASGRVLRNAGFRPTGRMQRRPSLGRGSDVAGPELALDLVDGDDTASIAQPATASRLMEVPAAA